MQCRVCNENAVQLEYTLATFRYRERVSHKYHLAEGRLRDWTERQGTGAAGLLAPSMKRISLLYSGGCIIRQIFEAKNEIRRVEMADKTGNIISAQVSTVERTCYCPRGRPRFPITRWLIVKAYCHSSAWHLLADCQPASRREHLWVMSTRKGAASRYTRSKCPGKNTKGFKERQNTLISYAVERFKFWR
ncbi:uncharacterized protein LOC124413656 [Diprion similis]|uniref:uncharacterized protein LOC124413656 n=1 Tax=Diprion similis TaxID=362088 RepID=UPI001EF7C183|nr:uncharacterized protein LOC124413656 [Diprion similis]